MPFIIYLLEAPGIPIFNKTDTVYFSYIAEYLAVNKFLFYFNAYYFNKTIIFEAPYYIYSHSK